MQCRVVCNDRIAARHDYEITVIQNAAIATKHISDQTLQTISVNCPPGLLAGYRQAQSRRTCRPLHGQHGKVGISRPLWFRENPLEIDRYQNPGCSRKPVVGNGCEPDPVKKSGDQSGTTFRASGVEYFTATTRGHAGAKAVGTGTLDAAGLERTFHDRDSD